MSFFLPEHSRALLRRLRTLELSGNTKPSEGLTLAAFPRRNSYHNR
jgi:hypothetical protein